MDKNEKLRQQKILDGFPLNDALNELRTVPRLSGTSACKKIARWLAERFRDMGYTTDIQDYTFVGWSVPEPPKIVNLNNGKKLPARAVTWCGGTKGIDVTGTIVPKGKTNFWGLGTIRTRDTWAIKAEREYKTVYLIGGLDAHWVLPYPMADIAYICLEQKDLQELSDSRAKIHVTTRSELSFGAQSENIIATKEGQTEHEIIICAHHDTVYDDDNGLHDNGGACATLLLLAELFKDINTHHTIRFLSTGGEEFNLVGARSYIKQRELEGSLNRVKAAITLDYITQPPRVVHVRCTEDFDDIFCETHKMHKEREHDYEIDGRIYRDLGCIDARAFEEKGISSFYYAPTNPNNHDEDNASISANLQTNALFVQDLILMADKAFALQELEKSTGQKGEK